MTTPQSTPSAGPNVQALARHWSELAFHANVLCCAKNRQERNAAILKVFTAIGNAKDEFPELMTAGEALAARSPRN